MGLGFSRRVQDLEPTAQRWRNLVEPPQLRRLAGVSDASDASVLKIDDEAILRLAKKLCMQHGAVWDASELDGAERWERNKIVVDDVGRRKYIALAREGLFKENGDA